MAEKPEETLSLEEKITQAKDLYGRGSRNYLVKSYSDAADDLSVVCSMYSDIYGCTADELGMPYLLYAKCLIGLSQDENNVLDIPENEEDGEEDEDDDDDAGDDGDDDDDRDEGVGDDEYKKVDDAKENKNQIKSNGDAAEVTDVKKDSAEAKVESSIAATTTDGIAAASPTSSSSASTSETEIKKNVNESEEKTDIDARTALARAAVASSSASTSNGHKNKNYNNDVDDGEPTTTEDDADGTVAANLQVAWEVLELAVKIFTRQGEPSLPNLADAYTELAEISLENGHFEMSIKDFQIALDIHMKLPDDNLRNIAEIQYKIGLCHLMLTSFEESTKAFKTACDTLDSEIESQKAKENQDEEKLKLTIIELEETKGEIMNKILEVEETKHQSVEQVKNELSKLLNIDLGCPSSKEASGDGNSSTSGFSSGESSSSKSTSLSPTSSGSCTTNAPTTAANATNVSSSSDIVKPKPTDISHLIKRKKPESNGTSTANATTTTEQSQNIDGAPAAKRPAL